MPKSKKPAGGRPAKNFDPSRGKKKSGTPGRPGTGRSDRFDRDQRPARGEHFERSERPARGERTERSERAPRRDDRYERDGQRPHRGEAPRPHRAGSTPRSERRFVKEFAHDERRPRDDRFARDDRPRRDYNDDRPRRQDRDDRPRRDDRGDRNERGSRPSRSDWTGKNDQKNRTPFLEDVVLERLEGTVTTAEDVADLTFADLGLGKNIVKALAEMGVEHPFPIQAATIPDVLARRDVLGRGRTGSGKTVAFGAPLVERLMANGMGKSRKYGRNPRALILAPTRELALQIDRTVQPIAQSVGLFTTQVYGGVPQGRQVMALRRGVDIIIATPGRLEDLTRQGHIDLGAIDLVVLDEADHMCDLGFLEPVQRILRQTDEDTQHLLFSATLDKGVAAIIDEFLVDPAVREVGGEDQESSTIDHRVLVLEHRDKIRVIEQLCRRPGKTLIFSRTRAFTEQLADALIDANISATSLHGDLNQNQRQRNLKQLTNGQVDVLVATDVAARGIHVDDIDLVIQADAPDDYKTYTHRAGRTGRAGRVGTVVTLIPKTRVKRMTELLERADIVAEPISVRAGDDIITEIAENAGSDLS